MRSVLLSYIIVLTSFLGRASVQDSTSSFKIPFQKPDFRLQVQVGTGSKHYAELFENAQHHRPILQGGIQYFFSQRLSFGLAFSNTAYLDHKPYASNLSKEVVAYSIGAKADYAFFKRPKFEAYLSASVSRYHFSWWEINSKTGNDVMAETPTTFTEIMPGGGLGLKWFPMKNIGLFAEAGYQYCLAQTGITVRL